MRHLILFKLISRLWSTSTIKTSISQKDCENLPEFLLGFYSKTPKHSVISQRR